VHARCVLPSRYYVRHLQLAFYEQAGLSAHSAGAITATWEESLIGKTTSVPIAIALSVCYTRVKKVNTNLVCSITKPREPIKRLYEVVRSPRSGCCACNDNPLCVIVSGVQDELGLIGGRSRFETATGVNLSGGRRPSRDDPSGDDL
jgi:hypothetical protein